MGEPMSEGTSPPPAATGHGYHSRGLNQRRDACPGVVATESCVAPVDACAAGIGEPVQARLQGMRAVSLRGKRA
jgi:hypothetical protein